MNTKRLTKFLAAALALIFVSWSSVSAKDKDEKEMDRLKNAATVLKEILDVPDNIPQDLIDKARCVIVFPSVVKAAFVVGGSYGRGTMVCRTGQDFSGPWGAPAMMALEAGSVGFQIGGQATDFVILVMNPRGVDSLLHSKVKLGAERLRCRRSEGSRCASSDRCDLPRGDAELFACSRCVCRSIPRGLDPPPRR